MIRTAQAAAMMIAIPTNMPPHPRTPTRRCVPQDCPMPTMPRDHPVGAHARPQQRSGGSVCPPSKTSRHEFMPMRVDRTRNVSAYENADAPEGPTPAGLEVGV